MSEFELQSSPIMRTSKNVFETGVRNTWTPRIQFSGETVAPEFTTQWGEYLKIGDVVFLWFYITLSNVGSGGALPRAAIADLPFESSGLSTTDPGQASFSISFWNAMTTALCSMGGYILHDSTTAQLTGIPTAAATSVSLLTRSDFANTSTISGHIAYLAKKP